MWPCRTICTSFKILKNDVKNIYTFTYMPKRQFGAKAELDKKVLQEIENGKFKPRKHPGTVLPRTITLPEKFKEAMATVFKDYPLKALQEDAKVLSNYLHARHLPPTKNEIVSKKDKIFEEVQSKIKVPEGATEEEKEIIGKKISSIVQKKLSVRLYGWAPIIYDEYKALQYMLARSAPEYAVIYRIFLEIKNRDPDFKPRHYFDFGSGIGTGTWAAREFWESSIFYYFNVDISRDMNDLALVLLKGGIGNKEPLVKGVYYRQFLPATPVEYDLVVSAFTLFELPSAKLRLETLLNLWNKTGKYLVIVEQGTAAGFKIISEARDYILQLESEADGRQAHVFSPCPHDSTCPRMLEDETPCNFEVKYRTLPIGQPDVVERERFCYVVLQRGARNNKADNWPRIVRPVLVRPRHSICRLCTARGQLEEVIFTATKYGKTTYHCARSSRWGDLLPVDLFVPEDDNK